MKAFVNGKIIMNGEIVENKVLVFDETIVDLCDTVPQGCEVIDVNQQFIGPGLIDVHIHGFAGHDVMDASEDGLKTICQELVKFGVTSFCPTTMTMDRESIENALACVAHVKANQNEGARILGVHLEGPYISHAYKGAQNPAFIVPPTFEDIKPYQDLIKLITIAPEEDENFNFIKAVKAQTDITLSIGHSSANYDVAKESIRCGITQATHTFNGMTGLHHRDPGVVGAVLMSKEVKAEVIADTIHINPALYEFIYHNKGREGIVLITDSIRAGGMVDGVYDLGGQEVVVADGRACLRSGSLAGSVLTLNKAVKNYVTHTNIPVAYVMEFASLNPAKQANVAKRKGSLNIGKDADIVIWSSDLNVVATYIAGECVYQA